MSGCFGKLCATAASKQPVKRYNLLVLAVFPQSSPAINEPLEVAVVRKIGKVQDYVAENQQRIPKVSRRFCRRIQRDLRANKLGYVKISVHAYIVLLARGKPQDSNVMAKELIDGVPGVISLLLGHAAVHVQSLGLELLVHFVRLQQDADFLQNLEELVQRTVKFIVPNSVADDVNERSCAALRAMREFVALLHRTARGSSQLGTAHGAALTMLGSQRVSSSRRALDVALVDGLQLQGDFTSDDAPSLAEGVLRNVAALAEDPVIGKEVVSRTLAHLDAKGAWLQKPLSSRALEILRSSLDALRLRALLLNVLVHHASAPSDLSDEARAAVVELAKLEVERLPPTLYFTSLIHAVDALAPTLPVAAEDVHPTGRSSLHAAVCAYLAKLAALMDGPELVLEVMSACLEKPQPEHGAARLACLLELAEHVAERGASGPAVEHFPHMLLQELVLTVSRGSVRERALANRIFVTLLPAFRQPLKAAHVELMQDALYEQLHPAVEHSPPQLATAAEALAGLIERGAPSMLPRTCQLLLTLVTLCDLAPRAGRSCELVAVLRACDYASQLLIRRCLGADQPSTVALPLRHWCANLRETADGRMEAACATFNGDEAQCLQLLESMRNEGRTNTFCVDMAAALALSPLIRDCGVSEAELLAEFRKSAAHNGPSLAAGVSTSIAGSTAVLTALQDLDKNVVDLSLDYLQGARTASNRDAASMPLNDALEALTALTTGLQNGTASYSTPWSRGLSDSKGGEPQRESKDFDFVLPPAVDVVAPAEAVFPRRAGDPDEPLLPVRPAADDAGATLQRVDSAQLPPVSMHGQPASLVEPASGGMGYWLGVKPDPAAKPAGAPAPTGRLPVRTRRRALHALAADEVGAMRNSSKPGTNAAFRAADDDSVDDFHSQASADEFYSQVSADDTDFDDAKSNLSRASFRSAASRL